MKATVGALTGVSRIRVIPDLPWSFDFEDGREVPPPQWANATGKFAVRDLEGNKVLVKLAENDVRVREALPSVLRVDRAAATTRSRRTSARWKCRRQMGDVGVVAQRYELVLFGNHQRLELQPWQPETERTVSVPFKWEKDTWYTMKLEVQSLDGGKVRARGKVWPKGEAEPAGVDDRAHRSDWQPEGQPGPLRRCAVERVERRLRDLLRQHQGLPEQKVTMTIKKLIRSSQPSRHHRLRARRSGRNRRTATGRCGAARPIATWSRT